jgi:alkylated DNA nucleotide flippase Atl1
MTYGEIAARLPGPAGIDPIAYRRIRARWVGYAMADAPPDVPWQRVVNARGRVSLREGFGPDLQRSLLQSEGIRLTPGGAVDLARYRWTPGRTGRRKA